MDQPAETPRFFKGRTVHVNYVNSVQILLELPFGVHVNKIIILDGIDQKVIHASGKKSDALRCLSLLLGGRRVFVKCEDRLDGMIPGTVFIEDFFPHAAPVGVTSIEQTPRPVLNVNAFYGSLHESGYDMVRIRDLFRS